MKGSLLNKKVTALYFKVIFPEVSPMTAALGYHPQVVWPNGMEYR
jgi:hypothetical protein